MLSLTINSAALLELKESINPDRINKQLAIGISLAVKELHSVLKHEVFARYNAPNDLDKAISLSVNNQQAGRGFIRDGITYVGRTTDLSRFPYSWEMGNINSWASKQGKVHSVSVVRGSPKILYGKLHFGGFIIKSPSGQNVMVERSQRATWLSKGVRAPLHTLYTLSLVDMANIMLLYNPNVQRSLDNFEKTIMDNLKP